MEPARPSGTVTFLFTDVENSTGWWDQHPGEMHTALERHDRIIQDAVAAHGGFVFSRAGDGVGVAFQRAGEAVAAAVEAQRALVGEPWPAGLELRVRMGVHTGEADERAGDYFGPPLNRAARLMSAAHGGQILVSATVADLLWSVPGIALVDVGRLELRGISDPIHAFGVSTHDLPWLEREPNATRTAVGNVPTPVDEWFGSVADLRRRVADLPRRRLVTLTGTGGVGKTRLALEISALAADEFSDGVWLVELAPLAEPASVAPAVASTLSVRPQTGATVIETIAEWLRGRRLLLVLDNCEHVLDGVADVAAAIVARCPTVTVLATSREPLGVAGERVVPLTGLETADAVGLFCDRVMAIDDTVTLSDEDHRAVRSICEELDGLPLAIELAAARVRALSPTEVRDRLGDRLRLLQARGRKGSDRHRTLRATVDWSYQLLTGDERCLFERLSVFAGGFDLAAVDAIGTAPPLDGIDVLEVLASLVDKSMVVADRGADGTRYRLLETLRQFAAERVADAGDVNDLRGRHLRYYVDVAQEAERRWATPRQRTADAILDREWDNLRVAHAWAVTTVDVQAACLLVAATGRHAIRRGRQDLGDWADRTLELASTGMRPTTVAYGWAAGAAVAVGDVDAGIRLAERGIQAAPWPDHPDAAKCWGQLIRAHLAVGRGDAAAEPARHLAVIEPALSDPWGRFDALTALVDNGLANDRGSVPGLVARLTELGEEIGAPSILSVTSYCQARSALLAEDPPDPARALTAARHGVEVAHTVGDAVCESMNTSVLAMAAVALRRPDAADICRDGIVRLYEFRFWTMLWLLIETTARLLAAAGSVQDAAILYGHLEAHHGAWGTPAARRARQRGLDRVRDLLETDLLMAQGAAMDRDELVAYTLNCLEPGQAQVEPA